MVCISPSPCAQKGSNPGKAGHSLERVSCMRILRVVREVVSEMVVEMAREVGRPCGRGGMRVARCLGKSGRDACVVEAVVVHVRVRDWPAHPLSCRTLLAR